jgi:hypothetical protein
MLWNSNKLFASSEMLLVSLYFPIPVDIKMVILMMVMMLEVNMIFSVVISCHALYSGGTWFESQQELID